LAGTAEGSEKQEAQVYPKPTTVSLDLRTLPLLHLSRVVYREKPIDVVRQLAQAHPCRSGRALTAGRHRPDSTAPLTINAGGQ
jgi:hypothetical protein